MNKIALISVSDKTGLTEFATGLMKNGFRIVSTGGTAKALKLAGINVREISEFTGFPEIFGGRLKTLHPAIFGGLLYRDSSEVDRRQAAENKISRIDLIAVNLYPFEKFACATPAGAAFLCADAIENIDIGGFAMLRAAAKNYEDVIAVCDPSDYNEVLETIAFGKDDIAWRLLKASKVFRYTAYYDSLIASYLTSASGKMQMEFPEKYPVALRKTSDLRYGENPHQKAAVYAAPLSRGVVGAVKIQGKELSCNNYLDLDSAWNAVLEFEHPACVIVKHNNPCGAAEKIDGTLKEAYLAALACDPVSAFGGIIAFNKKVSAAESSEVIKIFTECVIAPEYEDKALKIFSEKKDMRVIKITETHKTGLEIRQISGGALIQQTDSKTGLDNVRTVTKITPDKQTIESLKFAWKVAKNVKSNAIVLAKGCRTVGIGAGQMSRIDSVKLASSKMAALKLPEETAMLPLVMASDAFFPFRDVVDAVAKAGVRAIIQPGGSLRDKDSIKACDEHGIAMIFTGTRHFRH